DGASPISVGRRARRARVQDAADGRPALAERPARAILGEAAHADHEPRAQRLDDPHQRAIACLVEGLALGGGESVRGSVPARSIDEHERALVRDEEALEEALGGAVAIARPAPEARAADLAARAVEALHEALRVLIRRPPDLAGDAEEVPH